MNESNDLICGDNGSCNIVCLGLHRKTNLLIVERLQFEFSFFAMSIEQTKTKVWLDCDPGHDDASKLLTKLKKLI
jgi:hypothetical protein